MEAVCATQHAIVGGQSEVLASLGPAAAPIGRLETADGTVRCSAAIITPNWVVTAKHCVSELARIVSFSVGQGEQLRRFATSVTVEHPERDVMLVRLFDTGSLDVEPLPIWSDSVDSNWLGRHVVLAGYGDDAEGHRGDLAAVNASIVGVDSGSIEVDGDDARGACEGDSGGPLLWSDDAGQTFILGVLHGGSLNCRGKDAYERLDALGDWLLEAMARVDASPCAGVTLTGSCEHHAAHYCKDGLPIYDPCESGLSCGWDASVPGARCVTPESDACQGAIDGRCDGNDLLTCDQGEIHRTACGPCAQCVRSPMGGARCE